LKGRHACGQWLGLPEKDLIPAPPEILREMMKQSRLVKAGVGSGVPALLCFWLPGMSDVFWFLLGIATMVGCIVAAAYLCLLPPSLFLRGERWLTEEEFRAAVPGKAWCRYLPPVALVGGFLLHVIFFLIVRATCTNPLALTAGFLPLAFLWIYVPVGIVEVTAGVSVLVAIGRGRGGDTRFIAASGAVRAGVFRLCLTTAAFAAFLAAAYW
jgi:hypothetical protein